MAQADAEARCLEALDRGDHAGAATLLVREYGPQLLGYLCSVLRSEADAGEVFSMFSEDLWRGLPGFRRECPARVWCYRLAWHAAARFLRDPYRGRGRRLETTELSRLVEEVRSSVFLGRDQARQATLDRLREGLSPDERALLVLRVDRSLSWGEVALVLSEEREAPVEESSLRKRFERLKEKLAERARAEGLLE
jgi:RNA polymerase sigma-70 factor (ECF subfamily)